MQPMANMALRAARNAGQHIARAFDRPDLIKTSEKGHNDYVTNVDTEAESIIIQSLMKAYPDHKYSGEESGTQGNADSEFEWIIDPIDGTANFVHNIPHFCVSIACLFRGKLEHGVILDPLRQEEFIASRGNGCQFNGRRVRVRTTKDLDGAMISTGGNGLNKVADEQAAIYAEILSQGATHTQAGSCLLYTSPSPRDS